MSEIWKRIPGFEDYEASNLGRIRSFRKRSFPIILKPSLSTKYYGVTLNSKVRKKIGYLVLLTFIGPRPPGMVVCHNNDVPIDNRLENLRYDTPKENMRDIHRNHGGRHPKTKGDKTTREQIIENKQAKLEQTKMIIELRERQNLSLEKIGQKFGLSRSAICRIIKGNRRINYLKTIHQE